MPFPFFCRPRLTGVSVDLLLSVHNLFLSFKCFMGYNYYVLRNSCNTHTHTHTYIYIYIYIQGGPKVGIYYTVYSIVLIVLLRHWYLVSLTFKLSCLTLWYLVV